MTDYRLNNKRIAKNTLMLYIRMFLVMGVTLFSFRILLAQLGEEGYGIYNVVGGVVILFSFLSQALTQSTQRYLSFYLGKNDTEMLKKIFSMTINVYVLLSLVIFVLAESIGLWFLNTCMNFPEGAFVTVHVVYQCSVFTFIIQMLTIPYHASIISHERMSLYALFSIVEIALKLSAVLVLFLFNDSKVIIYSIAISIVSIVVWYVNHYYCSKQLVVCRYSYIWNKNLFRELISFSGWNMLGGIGNVGASQGINILFNIFHGVAVNAAMGISNQVSSAVSSFVTNMQTAFNPQIIKSYAAEDKSGFYSLIFRSSRFSFLLIFALGYPTMLCCETVFRIWLTEVPVYAVPFTQLVLAFCMIDAMSGSLWTAAQASGKVKVYMILISSLIFINVPVAFLLLKLGYSPIYVMGFKVLMNLVIHFTRIGYLHVLINFPSIVYLKKVMLPIALFTMSSVPVPLFISQFADSVGENICLMVFTVSLCVLLGFYILLTTNERIFIVNKLKYNILSIICKKIICHNSK